MSPQASIPVLIVGAGPVGLALACELARWGVRPRIVDAGAGPTPEHESRALGIQPRTLELLAPLGVTPALIDEGLAVRGFRIHNEKGELGRSEFVLHDTPYPFLLSLPQGRTERILMRRLERFDIEIEWNTTFVGLRQEPGDLRATLRRANGQQETATAAYIVGCDGAHSAVRHALRLEFEGEKRPEWWALADARLTWEFTHDAAQIFLGKAGPLAVLPLPGADRWRMIAPLPDHHADKPLEVELLDFRQLFADRAHLHPHIEEPTWIAGFRIHRRMVDRMNVGRAFLAGDAAHIHSPVGGQGMNLGIHDALNLAWKLALVLRHGAPSSLLESYHEERLPLAQATLAATQRATQSVMVHNKLARIARDRILKEAFKRPAVMHGGFNTLAMLGVDYGREGMQRDLRGGQGPSSGQRVAPLERIVAAGELTPDFAGFTIVLVDEPNMNAPDTAAAAPGFVALAARLAACPDALRAVHLHSRASHAHAPGAAWQPLRRQEPELRELRGESAALLALRPDGYLGWRGAATDGVALCDWLEKFGLRGA